MSYANLILDKHEHVATVTLNRTDVLNALNRALLDELAQVCREIDADPAVRVAVVTGAGRAFCSGGDLKETSFADAPAGPVRQNPADHWLARLLAVTKPTLAAVNGVAAGGGLALALGCDIRIASDRARFSTVFARIGVSVLDGMGGLLWRVVGLPKALELLYTADMLDAPEAERVGMVNYVVPHEELTDRSLELAARIAAGPPVALQLTKGVVLDSLGKSFVEHLPDQWAAQRANFALARHDLREGGEAFREKRPPRYRGLE